MMGRCQPGAERAGNRQGARPSIHAVILGAAGYGGGELVRLLHGHPAISHMQAVSRSHAGQALHTAHGRLRGFVSGVFDEEPDWSALAGSDCPVLFSAQPNGSLAAQWPRMAEKMATTELGGRLTIIDLSGDFRLTNATQYQTAYGHPHPCPGELSSWVYGLSEHRQARIRGARRIANPGCFATAVQLALQPLLTVATPEWVAIHGVTGSSGSGVHPSAATHHPERATDFRAYKPLVHQHVAEIESALARDGNAATELAFVPHSAPMVRGIAVTLQTRISADDAKGLAETYQAAYGEKPFIRLVSSPPRINHVTGSNACDIAIAVQGRQVVVMAALDNLIKGMAGQAVQNMNIALGLPETEGLFSV